MKTKFKAVLVMALSALLAAVVAAGDATTARAQTIEPSINLEWDAWTMGTFAPGASFSRTLYVIAFPLGTSVVGWTNGATTVVSPASTYIDTNQSATFTISGTVPTAPGPFTITVYFTYYTSTGQVTRSVLLSGTVSSGTPAPATYFVGVIPQTVSATPSAADCPAGASLVYFDLDDEDSDNQNGRSGWIGAIRSDRNTRFYFCRVDGRLFKPLSATNTVNNHYAVIKLGTNCPPGSIDFYRYWDNENSNNQNGRWTSSGQTSDFGTNSYVGNDTILDFCLFRSGADTMSSFPTLGIHYGVFAAAGFSKAVQSGWLFTDDEDATNNNGMSTLADAQRIVVPTGSNGRNTTVYTARVTPETRPVAMCSASPTSGFDSVYAVFDGGGSYARAGRSIVSYAWSFSWSGTATGPGPHSRNLGVGTHAGTLTVTDSAGESSSSVSCWVTVTSSTSGNCSEATSPASGDAPSFTVPACQ